MTLEDLKKSVDQRIKAACLSLKMEARALASRLDYLADDLDEQNLAALNVRGEIQGTSSRIDTIMAEIVTLNLMRQKLFDGGIRERTK